jgi:hypothetical protein
MVAGKSQLPGIVVPLPQVVMGGLRRRPDLSSRARSLLTHKIRVAISGTIGFRPFDCAFRD